MRTRIPFGDFLYFSRGERRGILVLTAIIVLVFFAGYYHSYQRKRQAAGKEDLRK
ncbi:hypothetical protein [Bacteroides helcogenes]|uniref:hypothetical protein n=1 Tax=Bacteroides helcogenes TaxID=290053 RepID=UPI0002EB6AB1